MKNKKSQSSIEMASIITFMLLSMTTFLLVISDQMIDKQEKSFNNLLSDIGEIYESEVKLASVVEDGYYREFFILKDIKRRDYTGMIYHTNDTISAKSFLSLSFDNTPDEVRTVYFPPRVMGQFVHGNNQLRKENGIIFLNCGNEPVDFTIERCISIDEDDDIEGVYNDCDKYLDALTIESTSLKCNVCCKKADICCPAS